MALHGQCPGFRGGKGAGRTGQFGVKGVVFGEFAGEEAVGEPCLFRRAARGQEIGRALAAVGGLLFDDLDEARAGRCAQKRVEPPEADAQRLGRRALGRVGSGIELAQEPEEQVFLGDGDDFGNGDPVESSLFTDEQMSQSRIRQKMFVHS
jgi:hypothetical protein